MTAPTIIDRRLIDMRGVGKRYEGVHALDAVDFDVRPGEVHALAGANGSGKSTLCKIISGAVEPDDGEVLVDGELVSFRTPVDASSTGIRMVYQSSDLVPTMSVAQNVAMGNEDFLMRMRTVNLRVQQLVQRLNFKVDPTAVVATLSAAQKQMVEIARALYSDVKLLILDEPTAALTPEEIVRLFHIVRELADSGVGVIFVSHALEEALEIADRVTVLRDGRRILTEPAEDLTRADLIHAMVGETTQREAVPEVRTIDPGTPPILRVENVTKGRVVKNMSFSLFPGEVLGLTGLVGSGRTEIAKIIAGDMKRDLINGGSIYLWGQPVRYRVPTQAAKAGIAYITEDRKHDGFFQTMTISQNIYTSRLVTREGATSLLDRREEQHLAQRFIEGLKVSFINSDAKISELSGGNQQKVVIAKSLAQDPDIIIFDEPTQGVDVAAIPEIHAFIRELAEEGKGVLVISSYIPEILTVSDRILVIRQGSVAAEFSPEEADEERIMFAAIH